MTPDGRPLAVFDLDGTLLPFNSFHYFLVSVLLSATLRGRWTVAAGLLKAVADRAARCTDHVSFKVRVCQLASAMPANDIHRFAVFCSHRLRPAMRMELDRYRKSGHLLCLCTAAPALYSQSLGQLLGFDVCVAFDAGGCSGVDNSGNAKLNGLERALGHGLPWIEVMFSDHGDDLPLLRIARRPVLVAPSRTQLQRVLAHLPVPPQVMR